MNHILFADRGVARISRKRGQIIKKNDPRTRRPAKTCVLEAMPILINDRKI